jgi:hypothetical protein
VSAHLPPRLHFDPLKIFNFDFNPESAFCSNADPDPDSCSFGNDLQDAKKILKNFEFFFFFLFEGTFTSFFKDTSHKKSHNSRNNGFSFYFCLMMEGFGSVPL